ncbi:MAG: hypothetical protein ACFHXK_12620 [bacterium]
MHARITPGPYSLDPEPGQTPFFFGEDSNKLLFGWLHSPDPAHGKQGKGVGVVLCNPFGFEEVAAHRGLRTLAIECASSGFPCIRFDYLGCGNSAGDEYTENQVQQWVESIRLAIEAIKILESVEQVILVGFRLGFSLAAMASENRSDVLGMVAVSPVVKGREYLRELRLLTSPENQDDACPNGIALAPSGFIVTDSTASEIQDIDLAEVKLGTKELLIIEEVQIPPRVDTWSQIAQRSKISVETMLSDGYLQLSADPQTSQVPSNLFGEIIRCVEEWSDVAQGAPGIAISNVACSDRDLVFTQCRPSDSIVNAGSSKGAHETIVSVPVGSRQLFGIVHESTRHVSERTVVFLNAGMVRNIGPNRMFVPLARACAQEGVRVLRFDFSAVGDSASQSVEGKNASYSHAAGEELAAVIRFVKQLGASEIKLVGLCSGAYHAFRGIVAGLPVHSAILINPLAFDQQDLEDEFDKSFATYEVLDLFANIKRQIHTGKFWMKLRRGQLDIKTLRKLVIRRFRFSIVLLTNSIFRKLNITHASDIVQDVRDALGYGTKLNFLFSESDPGFELLSRRIGNTLAQFRSNPNFLIDTIPNADHTFTNVSARSRLVRVLEHILISNDLPECLKR